jgi:hypothetical protein
MPEFVPGLLAGGAGFVYPIRPFGRFLDEAFPGLAHAARG